MKKLLSNNMSVKGISTVNNQIHVKINVENSIKELIENPMHILKVSTENGTHISIKIDKKEKPSSQFIANLIKEKDHWFPNRINKKMNNNIRYSNAIEGVFGNLKSMLDFKRKLLVDVVKCIKIQSDSRIRNSKFISRSFIDERIISKRDQIQIGKTCLEILKKEYECIIKNDIPSECKNCSAKINYNIPCKHDILKNMQHIPHLTINDISPKWILESGIFLGESKENKPKDKKSKYSYNNLMTIFADIVSNAQHNTQLQQNIDEFIMKCNSLKRSIGSTGIEIYKTAGKRKQHISRNVDHKKRRGK